MEENQYGMKNVPDYQFLHPTLQIVLLRDAPAQLEWGDQTSTIRSILQIICKADLEKSHSAGTFEQNNANFNNL
jgi:hypothetical protein